MSREGPGLTLNMAFSKDKLKDGRQKDSTEGGTVACSVVDRNLTSTAEPAST